MKAWRWLLPALLAAGCAALPPAPKPAEPPLPQVAATPSAPPARWMKGDARPAGDADSLLLYYEYIRKLGAAELGREHELTRQEFAGRTSEFNRLRLALLLSLPGTPLHDDARALAVLEPLAREAHEPVFRSLALWLSAAIGERRKLEESVQALNARLREEQKHSESLQQKLEALKTVEKNLLERAQGKPRKK